MSIVEMMKDLSLVYLPIRLEYERIFVIIDDLRV